MVVVVVVCWEHEIYISFDDKLFDMIWNDICMNWIQIQFNWIRFDRWNRFKSRFDRFERTHFQYSRKSTQTQHSPTPFRIRLNVNDSTAHQQSAAQCSAAQHSESKVNFTLHSIGKPLNTLRVCEWAKELFSVFVVGGKGKEQTMENWIASKTGQRKRWRASERASKRASEWNLKLRLSAEIEKNG